MKRVVKWLLLPAVVIAGMIVVGADTAEARRWFRRPPARVIVAPRYYYPPRVYVHPPAFPRVHVHGPGVHVNVDPWWPFYRSRGSVVAPGVHVRW